MVNEPHCEGASGSGTSQGVHGGWKLKCPPSHSWPRDIHMIYLSFPAWSCSN